MNDFKRFEAAKRRFVFESLKALGVFWVIDKISFLEIKPPYRKMYDRKKGKK